MARVELSALWRSVSALKAIVSRQQATMVMNTPFQLQRSAIQPTPVPATDGKVRRQLIAQFRTDGLTQQPGKPEAPATPEKVVPKPKAQPAPVRPAPSRVSVGERLARLWPAGLVAAAILVGVVTWVILGGGSSTPEKTVVQLPPDPMLEKVVTA